METMEKTKMNKSNFNLSSKNLTEKTIETIDRIKRYAEFMDYRVSGDFELDNLEDSIRRLSWNQSKKLRNYIIKANYLTSLRSINRFLHFLYKNVLKTDKRVRIYVPEVEESIQKARKEWIKKRDEAEVALFIYKETKGDYYKNKSKKNEIAKNM